MSKKVGFYCEHAFAIYDIVPLIDDFNREEIVVISYLKYVDEIVDLLKIDKSQIIILDKYISKFGQKFTSWFIKYGVREDFSENFKARKNIKQKKNIILDHLLNFMFKGSNQNVNYRYTKLFKFIFGFRLFKTFDIKVDTLYVLTKVLHPYLLVPYSNKIHLIIESWDHPMKEPFLIHPLKTYAWNNDLLRELEEYQGYEDLELLEPLKFRYIKEFNECKLTDLVNGLSSEVLKDLDLVNSKDTVIYPMCTSSSYHAFLGEVEFVKDLAVKLNTLNLRLYIRPYPLAPYDDRVVLSKIPNVIVGIGNDIPHGKEVFNLEHLTHKYLLIIKAKSIINVGTTFVFDAALVGVKKHLIQLIINDEKYGDFNAYSKGNHIKKYLHIDSSLKFDKLSEQELQEQSFEFRDFINEWLLNSKQ